MKKVINVVIFLFCLMGISLNVNAQNEANGPAKKHCEGCSSGDYEFGGEVGTVVVTGSKVNQTNTNLTNTSALSNAANNASSSNSSSEKGAGNKKAANPAPKPKPQTERSSTPQFEYEKLCPICVNGYCVGPVDTPFTGPVGKKCEK